MAVAVAGGTVGGGAVRPPPRPARRPAPRPAQGILVLWSCWQCARLIFSYYYYFFVSVTIKRRERGLAVCRRPARGPRPRRPGSARPPPSTASRSAPGPHPPSTRHAGGAAAGVRQVGGKGEVDHHHLLLLTPASWMEGISTGACTPRLPAGPSSSLPGREPGGAAPEDAAPPGGNRNERVSVRGADAGARLGSLPPRPAPPAPAGAVHDVPEALAEVRGAGGGDAELPDAGDPRRHGLRRDAPIRDALRAQGHRGFPLPRGHRGRGCARAHVGGHEPL